MSMSASVNTAQILKQLLQVQKQLPKITSQAMKGAVFQARDDARKSASKKLDRPRAQTLDFIKAKWPTRQQVIQGKAVAEVFIDPKAVEWLGPNIIQERETSTPKAGRGILQPTRNFKLNRHGNIASFHGGRVRQLRRNKALYLDVPLGSKSKRTKHLSAGLYKRVGEGRRARLVKIISYKKTRTIKPKWTEYPHVVGNSYQKNYIKLWRAGYRQEVKRIAKR